jgi:hypothetical protein
MSIVTEIRDALLKTPGLTAGDLLEACPSASNTTEVSGTLFSMIERGEVLREGQRGSYQHSLVEGYTPKRSAETAPPPKTKPAKKAAAAKNAAKKAAPKVQPETAKSQRTAAKRTRVVLATVPAVIEPIDTHWVALQANGNVLIMEKESGEFSELPPHVAAQVANLIRVVVH